MFGRRIRLGSLLGFEIRFDLTWLIVVGLIVWSLSAGYFPLTYADLPAMTYFWMGLLGAAGLFASILLHELAHSVVGRSLGMRIQGITLFAFGGAAELTDEPATARTEFLMAIAGPVTSVALAGVFYLAAAALSGGETPGPIVAVLGYLAMINLLLAAFNMLPGFPLDGGRVLRAALWAWRGDVVWATRMAAGAGGVLGLFLIFIGVLNVLRGAVVGGMWFFLIGLFIRAAAASAQQRQVARSVLGGVSVRRLMRPQPIAVAPDLTAADLAEDYLLGRNLKVVPVVEGGRFLGVAGVEEIKATPPEARPFRRLAEILRAATPDMTTSPEADAADALAQMQRTEQSRLYVVAPDGRLLGVLAVRDMLQYLGLRSELQPQSLEAPPAARRT